MGYKDTSKVSSAKEEDNKHGYILKIMTAELQELLFFSSINKKAVTFQNRHFDLQFKNSTVF